MTDTSAPVRPVIDEQTLDKLVDFHGHLCPGLTMGALAATIALAEIGPNARDQQVVAVVETDMCGVDAIQSLTSCTFGKGNLIHRDWGKKVFSFYRPGDGKGVRIAARPGAAFSNPQLQALQAHVDTGEATPADRAQLKELRDLHARQLLERDPYELYTVSELRGPVPERDRSKVSVACATCGEDVKESRTVTVRDRRLCHPCAEGAATA